jgi:flagellar hook-length control protein FliK
VTGVQTCALPISEPEQSKQAQPPIATDEGTIILEQAAPPSDTEASVDHTPASQPQTTADAAESAPPATEAKPQPHAGPAETAPGARPAAPSASPGVVSAQDFELAGLRSMLEKAEGALATVVLDQLASLPLADDRQSVWQIDIPYTNDQGADVARLKVVREGKRGAAAAQSFWSVTLQLKPPGLGTLNARITLIGGSIDSYFWSDRPATTDMVASHLDVLAARLQHAGLDIGRLDTLPAAPSDAADTAPGQAFSILDEKA